MTLYLQELRGWSSLQTAIALVVLGCDAILAPTLTPHLVTRFGHAKVILGGFVLAVVAYGLFLPVGLDWSYAAMFPTLIIAGTAFALAYGPLTIAATDGVAESEQGLASGLLHTFTQFGSAIGISAVTAVYGLASSGASAGSDPDATLSAFRAALIVPVAMVTSGDGDTGRAAVVLRPRKPYEAADGRSPCRTHHGRTHLGRGHRHRRHARRRRSRRVRQPHPTGFELTIGPHRIRHTVRMTADAPALSATAPSAPVPAPAHAQRTRVVIVGAGPAGLTLANILRAASVDCVVLENESRAFIEQRPRAGFLEEWAVRALEGRGLADRLLENTVAHTECEFRFAGERHRFPYADVSGHRHYVYPQPSAGDGPGARVRGRAGRRHPVRCPRRASRHDIDTDRPSVAYTGPETGRPRSA